MNWDGSDERIYLDNNASTRVDPSVVAALLPLFTEYFSNPSSVHSFGAGVSFTVAEKVAIARALNAAGAPELEIGIRAMGAGRC